MNKDNEEWGNIELPGLSDEELFTKNWNRVAGGYTTKEKWDSMTSEEKESIREKMKANRDKQSWLQKNILKNKDPELRKKLSKIQQSTWNDESKINNRLNGMHEYWSNDENRKSRQEFHKSDKFLNAIELRSKDPNFGKSISLSKMKPIHTPWGIYASKGEAEKQGKLQDIKNIERKILNGLKDDSENFYYISKEEYEKLTK